MKKSPCKICTMWKKYFPTCLKDCNIISKCQNILSGRLENIKIKLDYDPTENYNLYTLQKYAIRHRKKNY